MQDSPAKRVKAEAGSTVSLGEVKRNGKSNNSIVVKVLHAPESGRGTKMPNGRQGCIYVGLVADEE